MGPRKGKRRKRGRIEVAESPPFLPEAIDPGPIPLRIMIVALVLAVSTAFLFLRLGHYALWDDEALTAIPALGVWRTGDTSLVDGKNLVAYRDGAMVTNWHDRTSPPWMFYMAAPSLGLLGRSAWAARLPFALLGIGCVALMLRWAWRAGADAASWVLLALAILGNVSFFLFFRQCRYYAPAILLSTAIVHGYVFYDGRRRSLVALSLLSLALLASNPMNDLALYAGLAVDYAIWGRRRRPLAKRDWPWLFGPHLVLGALILAIWNPWNGQVFEFERGDWIVDKATLLHRNLRDLNRCEFGVLPVLAVAPLLYFLDRRDWLLRAPLGLLVYVMAMTAVSPQPVHLSPTADVRYLVPVIPLCMAIEVLALGALSMKRPLAAIPLGLLAFGANVVHLDTFLHVGYRSTVREYLGELARPPDDPYTLTAAWINEHVAPGRSVCVLPLYMTYPLMFHAPSPVYAWQLDPSSSRRFEGLDPIHFRGRSSPDYFVAFGPAAEQLSKSLPTPEPIRYLPVATLDIFWKDLHRPELFWRTFETVFGYDKDREAIYIFRKTVEEASSHEGLGEQSGEAS